MLKEKNTILVVAAHPDDEVLGCGGSMAKWAQSGDNVHVLILAEGATARDKIRDTGAKKSELSQLAKSAHETGSILGVKSVNLLGLPDNRMDSLDLLDVVIKVEYYIEKFQPNAIVTHHGGDLNIDHQIALKAVITACRPQPSYPVKRILSFEVPSSTEWQSPNTKSIFIPNWFENITNTLDLKLKALDAYKSEMREWPHARSINAVKHLAHWRGASVGCEAAEAFMLVREIS